MSNSMTFEVASARAVLLSYAYPLSEELVWVGGTIRSWDAALVEVTLSDGTTGVGEAGAGIMAAPTVPGIVASFLPYLEGEVFDHPLDVGKHLRAYTAFWSRGGIANGVAGALEMACVDAVAKRAGLPAYDILGGKQRDAIEVYASGGLGQTFDEVLTWALEQYAAGFRTVKFRAMKDPATTIELVKAVIPQLPEGLQFVVDAVQGCASHPWSVTDAIDVGHHVAAAGGRWYEEPCQGDDTAGYAAVREAVNVPVSGVESHSTLPQFRELISAGAVDIAQPDASFVGGIASFHEVADLAAAAGIAAVPHVWGSGVTFMGNLHACFAHPSVELFEYCTLPNPLRDALMVSPSVVKDSALSAPTSPGLGVSLTPELEREFPYRPGGGHVIR
jgi:L-alanine-DL-glutamate epimerase-like enolase superfamily enzyme